MRRGAAGERVDVVETRHVFDGDFNAEVKLFFFAGVDNRDGSVDGCVEGGFEFGEGLIGRRRSGIGVGCETGSGWFGLRRYVRKQIPRFARDDSVNEVCCF